ncbi:MAG: GNAT family N-acetyltransferase [Flavobacterium sp.]|nr:GNAT family N-acetyltransferase [Flavobacterium sp.]
MKIKSASESDLEVVMSIIDDARQLMRKSGNLTQWSNGYPSSEIILDDISSGHGFVCIEDSLPVGYFCFMHGENPDPNYNVIEAGKWLNDQPYGVIHRLASSGKKRGIAQAAFDFAFSRISNVRVDTHHDNLPMQRFLRNNQFVYCGIIYVQDGSPRDAFQKLIK